MGTITRGFANLITASGPSSVPALGTLTVNNIQFPAISSRVENGNTLDDFEEGTFTATLRGFDTAPDTPVTTTGRYVKISGLVFIKLYFSNVNTTGAGGTLQITGMPFTAESLQILPIMCYGQDFDTSNAIVSINVYIENNTTLSLLATKDNEAWQATGITAGATKFYAVTGTYYTTS